MKRLFLFAVLLFPAMLQADDSARSLYSSDQLVQEITNALQAHFRLQGELDVDLPRPWTAPEQSAVKWEFGIEEYPGLAGANMLLRIRLKADGQVVDNHALMVHASLWRDVWVAKLPLRDGTVFSPELLDTRRVDVFVERDALPTDEGGDSYVFGRQVAQDRVITWHDITRRPLVHRGQVVDVTGSEGSLSLRMKALAMETGARGDLVTVRNLESRKDITGIVVGEDQVQVRF
ncbi:MAG TPA: flagellar basal body P-ring formation chaperone FlgA [Opitutaceae bacterium]|jgi:flagella basal body P-ring formation protein FlgA